MKFLIIFILTFPIISFANPKATVVTYRYTKSSKAKTKSISFGEVQRVYMLTKKQSPFYPPAPKKFFKEYLRFKLGAETALHDKKLIKDSSIDTKIADPYLKENFYNIIYRALAESKLKKQMSSLQKRANKLSTRQLKALYAKDPQYNFFFISINHPVNATAKQKTEAKKRAQKVYSQVTKSKKNFAELVNLYSDDKLSGLVNVNQTRATIYPSIYKALQKMKNKQIKAPIKIPLGYVIVKLNAKIPFSKQIHETAIKQNYFSEASTKAFNVYMDSLKKNFRIKYSNKKLINSLR